MPLFTNQATLTYNNTTVNSNVATGELLEVLSAAKNAVTDSYTVDEAVTYVVSIVNSGTVPFTGLTVTDDLGAYTQDTETLYPLTYVPDSVRYYINGTLQPVPTVTDGPPLTVSGINVPGNSNAIIIYEARPNGFAPPASDGTIVNTATVSGGGLVSPVTASETVRATADPRLSITKTICPSTVTENDRVTYTFTIQNYGNAPVAAADNAAVTDTFAPILTDLTVLYNGTPWTEGTNYTYDETTGLFATVPGQILVPAAAYTQNPDTGIWIAEPGVSTVTVTGTI